ncbi:MAG: glutamate racemase [Deltaproteobacteria bacterium]|nr:MAG: glutamate racemase [Deltaproteobacteria bacterium]
MEEIKYIGIFDSGKGGLSILSTLSARFPTESFAYIADTAHVPYGGRSAELVINYTLMSVRSLLKRVNLKFLIIACNTSTAHSLSIIRKVLRIPVLGIIQPIIESFCNYVKICNEQSVLILGTQSTIKSGIYETLLKRYGFKGQIKLQSCPLLVALIEEGVYNGPLLRQAVKYYLRNLNENIRIVILACTHYPLILKLFENESLDKISVKWIDGRDELVKIFAKISKQTLLSYEKNKRDCFFSTDLSRKFLRTSLKLVKRLDLSEITQI